MLELEEYGTSACAASPDSEVGYVITVARRPNCSFVPVNETGRQRTQGR